MWFTYRSRPNRGRLQVRRILSQLIRQAANAFSDPLPFCFVAACEDAPLLGINAVLLFIFLVNLLYGFGDIFNSQENLNSIDPPGGERMLTNFGTTRPLI